MPKFKIAVLGPIPRDTIVTHHGEVIQKYGCATHTSIALSRLLGTEGIVIPVTHVRKKDEGPIKKLLGAYSNIELNHITSDADRGDVVRLRFLDQNNRLEKQTGFMNPITPDDVKDLLDCDAFVCVPITDYEVPLDTLKYIKQHSKGIIILDAHGPTNTLTVTGDRLIKFWADRDMWLPYIDVLKMNLEESQCCWFKNEYLENELKALEPQTDHLADLAQHCLHKGLKSLIVTLDSRGCVVYQRVDGQVKEEFVSSIPVTHVVDTTGCGDSFAGGLGYGLLNDPTDFCKAAKFANAMGAQRTQGTSFEVFQSLEVTVEMIRAHYGDL
ncbi:MAG: carbohydrate kinase family protein [Saprospirales bacterium]|nr:carbohydrate kinase family protein [Saprospirales bacterium]